LGWFPDPHLVNQSIMLETGDRLVLFTDGIIESRSKEGEMFGMERLANCICTHSALEPDALAEEIIQQLIFFSDRDKFDDDITLVICDVL
jgi:sigma-B regulation protein RsbU (phosphoserine phosphatase)